VERIDLDSTALAWIRYRSEQRVLQVGLRTGRDYDYFDVPASTYQELLTAESKGRYYNLHIRNDFPFREIRRSRPG
jgi:hypothetical protein